MDVYLFWSLYLMTLVTSGHLPAPQGVVFAPFTDEKTESQRSVPVQWSVPGRRLEPQLECQTWGPLYHIMLGSRLVKGSAYNTTSCRLFLLLSLLDISKGRKCWQLIWGWRWGRCLWCNSSNALVSFPGWHGSLSDPEPLPQLRDPPGDKDLETGGWKGEGPPDEGKSWIPSPSPAILRSLSFSPLYDSVLINCATSGLCPLRAVFPASGICAVLIAASDHRNADEEAGSHQCTSPPGQSNFWRIQRVATLPLLIHFSLFPLHFGSQLLKTRYSKTTAYMRKLESGFAHPGKGWEKTWELKFTP